MLVVEVNSCVGGRGNDIGSSSVEVHKVVDFRTFLMNKLIEHDVIDEDDHIELSDIDIIEVVEEHLINKEEDDYVSIDGLDSIMIISDGENCESYYCIEKLEDLLSK